MPTTFQRPKEAKATKAPTAANAIKHRKSHKKLRLGCDNCKQRRIKCDELFPQCLRCTVHKVQCSYQRLSHQEKRDFLREKYYLPLTPDPDDETDTGEDSPEPSSTSSLPVALLFSHCASSPPATDDSEVDVDDIPWDQLYAALPDN